jgi:hypothetical protein
MTGAVLEAPLSLFSEATRPRAPGGRRATLEERLNAALRAARSEGTTECPVCGTASMRWEEGTAHCGGCGSTLS